MYLLIQFTNKLDDNLKLNERNENVNAKAIKTRLNRLKKSIVHCLSV